MTRSPKIAAFAQTGSSVKTSCKRHTALECAGVSKFFAVVCATHSVLSEASGPAANIAGSGAIHHAPLRARNRNREAKEGVVLEAATSAQPSWRNPRIISQTGAPLRFR